MKLLPDFTGDYWLYMVKITTDMSTACPWVIRARGSGRNLDLNNQPQVESFFAQPTIWTGKNSRNSFKKVEENYSKTYVKTLKRLKERINRVSLEKINRRVFKMITSEPTLELPLQQRYSTSNLKLFHTLSTVCIWHCLTPACLQLWRKVSKEFHSHIIKTFKWLWESDFGKSLKCSTAIG